MRDKRDTIRIKVINAHAPHFGIEDDKIHDQFYRGIVRQAPAGWAVILLGDMNASLSDSESPGVGLFSEDRENENGMRLRAFAAECNMALMNTFIGDVPLSTWRALRGQEHRIVYTAIAMKDIGRVVHAGVRKDISMAFSTEIGHWPASMQVRMCAPKRPAVKDAPRWDRAAMKDVSLGNVFPHWIAKHIDRTRTRPGQCSTTILETSNVERHCTWSRQQVLLSFPKCGPRKQWVCQRAFELMKQPKTTYVLRDDVSLLPLFRSWQATVRHLCDSDARLRSRRKSELRKAKRDEVLCLYLL